MTKNQSKKPLSDALDQYARDKVIPFHTPGHKQGRSLDNELAQLIDPELLATDLTEVEGLDNLHQPEGVIQEAQILAAALAGAKESWLVVSGKAAALYASLSAILLPGDCFLMDRTIGPEGWQAAVLGNYVPVLMPVRSVHQGRLFPIASPDVIKECLDLNPSAKAVLTSGMSEAGIACDLNTVRNICSNQNSGLIVDDTHNSTTLVLGRKNANALSAGADLVVYSNSSQPGFPAQGALIFRGTDRISTHKIQAALQIIQSTSPSYLIMAALDDLRFDLWRCGSPQVQDQSQILEYLRGEYQNAAGRQGVFLEEILPADYYCDPLRVTVCFPGAVSYDSCRTDFRYGSNYIVFTPGIGAERLNPSQILDDLLSVHLNTSSGTESYGEIDLDPYISPTAPFWYGPKEAVPLMKAAGKRLARPFRIPGSDGGWLYPGETIPHDIICRAKDSSCDIDLRIEIIREV